MKKIIRLIVGLLLIAVSFPPATLGVVNFFSLIPALIGCVVILAPWIIRIMKRITGKHYKAVFKTISIIIVLCLVFFVSEFAVLFSNSFADTIPDNAVVVVLGAQVRGHSPTTILRGRIEAAAGYLKAHSGAVCIAAGGQGADEDKSEADCIKDTLVSNYGISPDRIYTDTSSTDTLSNFKNADEIIKQNNLSQNVAIATDGFHMFRAKLLASRCGLKPYSCPSSTDKRLAPTFYLRELFALPKTVLFDR